MSDLRALSAPPPPIYTVHVGDRYTADNVVNISAMLFMWTTLPAFGAASYVPQIVMERSLFMRERADGLYSPATYIVAKMFDEMLMLFFVSLVIAAVVFYAVQLSVGMGLCSRRLIWSSTKFIKPQYRLSLIGPQNF